ncbi:Small GTPase Cdc42 [Mycena sanguinolenta]|uniref:Small GTPase Cdc42 n=1 Tax=Mycena sanguinolenta TaxID=230812 RepID=A0A8H7CPR1_9AGAR|nr:Small GTPase Cdc42 [Mycena sanguinolenta]
MSGPSMEKFVLIGDPKVGKNSMHITFVTNVFPIVRMNPLWRTIIVVPSTSTGNRSFVMSVVDCGEGYERLRPISYPHTDAFLACFSIANRDSFDAVRSTWVPEIRYFCPDVPFIVVGTKIDLRDDSDLIAELARQDKRLVASEEGERLGFELGAAKYVECSTLARKGLYNVFEELKSLPLSGNRHA